MTTRTDPSITSSQTFSTFPAPDTDLSRGRHQFHSESHRGRTPKAIGGSELGSSVERTYAARWKPEAVGQKICCLDFFVGLFIWVAGNQTGTARTL